MVCMDWLVSLTKSAGTESGLCVCSCKKCFSFQTVSLPTGNTIWMQESDPEKETAILHELSIDHWMLSEHPPTTAPHSFSRPENTIYSWSWHRSDGYDADILQSSCGTWPQWIVGQLGRIHLENCSWRSLYRTSWPFSLLHLNLKFCIFQLLSKWKTTCLVCIWFLEHGGEP